MWTLHCCNKRGLKHGDLHFGNIWVDDTISPQKYIYFISEIDYFVIPIYQLVKVFDWDRASAPDVQNTLLSYWACKDHGVCNENNPKFDLFMVLYSLYYDRNVPAQFRDGLERYIDLRFMKTTQTKARGRLCKVHKRCDRFGTCTEECGNFIPSDNLMMTPEQVLKSGYERFKKKLPEFDPGYLPIPGIQAIFFAPGVKQGVVLQNLQLDKIKRITFDYDERLV